METLDIIILVCFIPAIVRGIQKGFISQAISLASILIGVWLAFQFSEMVGEALSTRFPQITGTIASIISFILILTVVAILLGLVGKLLKRIMKTVSMGWVDHLLGLIFSLLRAALVIGLVIILFDTINLKFDIVKAEKLDASTLYNPIKNIAYKVFPYLKALLFKQ